MDSKAEGVGPGEKLVYQVLAEAFAAEGVDHQFLLMGDGQMMWATAMDAIPGMRSVDARHEHCAVMEAVGYHFATGKVGVASTTNGPGFTQIITALTGAVQGRVPLVVFVADSPLNRRWVNQHADEATLTLATGARFIAAHSTALMQDYVQEAFYTARFERRPVVLSVPHDLMTKKASVRKPYVPSSALLPEVGPMPPSARDAERLAERLSTAERPIIIAGRGAMRSGAQQAIEELAEKSGALLATTLPARGYFDGNPFSIGVAGGYSGSLAAECFGQADFVLAIGASMTFFTTGAGSLFPQAEVAQIDEEPLGLHHGFKVADLYVRSDARLGTEAVAAALSGGTASTFRTSEMAQRIADTPADADPAEFDIEPGLLDPRAAVREIDRIVPKDWEIVSGTGHSARFYAHLRGRRPEQLHMLREFGAIGNGLSIAIGVAVARGNGKVLLLDGDGSVMMHIQELEAVARQGIKLLVCALNDGGFGAEIHRLRALDLDESLAAFGHPDFAKIARGFDLAGATITELPQFEAAFAEYQAGDRAMIWDARISNRVNALSARKGALH